MSLSPSAAPYWEILDLNQVEQEYTLFDSVNSEFNDINGFPIYYYIKEDSADDIDYLYGENQITGYSDAYRTKIVYEPSEELSVLNVFGFSSDDELSFALITKTIFKRDVATENGNSDYVPMVGDVIRTLWNNKIYEIAEVGSEQQIFQGEKLIWEFILKPYRSAEESASENDMLFDTPDLDDFPLINTTTTTDVLSAGSDNQNIEDESDEIEDIDGSIYGY